MDRVIAALGSSKTISQQDTVLSIFRRLSAYIYTQLLQRTQIDEGMPVKYIIVTVALAGSISL